MKVIIAGGSGLIGQALIKRLKEQGFEIVVISRNPKKAGTFFDNIQVIPWDREIMRDHFEGAHAVINLAGESIAGQIPFGMRWTPRRKFEIINSRIAAGNLISNAFQLTEKKPKVLIQASAVGIYGPRGDEELSENEKPGQDFLSDVAVKWEGSSIGAELPGVRRLVLRIGLVLSNEAGIFPLLKFPFQLFLGGVLGNGKQYMSWIHIDDLVEAIIYLLRQKSSEGVYNLTAPEPVKQSVFAKALGHALRRPGWSRVPAFVFKLLLGESSTLILEGQNVIPERLLDSGFQFTFPMIEDALQDLTTR